MILVEHLNPNMAYNVTALVITAYMEYAFAKNKGVLLSTLQTDFKPDKVSNVTFHNYSRKINDEKTVKAIISWKPAEGKHII